MAGEAEVFYGAAKGTSRFRASIEAWSVFGISGLSAQLCARQALGELRGDHTHEDAGIKLVLMVVEAPLRQIVLNAGEDPPTVVGDVLKRQGTHGFAAAKGAYGTCLCLASWMQPWSSVTPFRMWHQLRRPC